MVPPSGFSLSTIGASSLRWVQPGVRKSSCFLSGPFPASRMPRANSGKVAGELFAEPKEVFAKAQARARQNVLPRSTPPPPIPQPAIAFHVANGNLSGCSP